MEDYEIAFDLMKKMMPEGWEPWNCNTFVFFTSKQEPVLQFQYQLTQHAARKNVTWTWNGTQWVQVQLTDEGEIIA